MPRTGRPKAELVLTGDERAQLQRWARRNQPSETYDRICHHRDALRPFEGENLPGQVVVRAGQFGEDRLIVARPGNAQTVVIADKADRLMSAWANLGTMNSELATTAAARMVNFRM